MTDMMTPEHDSGAVRIAMIHAYSRSNSGDGLLVDESAELVREAFPAAKIDLIALAPQTFPEFPEALHPIYGTGRPNIPALARAATGRLDPAARRVLARADLIVAVGGGYLRATNVQSFVKTALAHLPQLPSSSTPATIYLPQSVGPFPLTGRVVRKLKHARHVFVRDDLSLSFLRTQNVAAERLPDLALLSPRLGAAEAASGHGFGLVARDLGRRERSYDAAMVALRDRLNARPLVQSSGRGNNDPAYYRRIGFGDHHTTVAEALDGPDRPSVMVSVRLHGSLQSLHSGTPTIHLSYERKGWGAFDDLGLRPFVHSARHFDLDQVVEQAQDLAADSSSYWDAVTVAKANLRKARDYVLNSMRDAVRDI